MKSNVPNSMGLNKDKPVPLFIATQNRGFHSRDGWELWNVASSGGVSMPDFPLEEEGCFGFG
jgi:hypothetical protein